MNPKRDYRFTLRVKGSGGFTLMEVLLAVFFLALMATAFSAVYSSGFQARDYQINRMLLDSRLRSRMEVLVGTTFGTLSNGSEVVTVNGENYTITWTVVLVDLNGDSTPEPNAKQVTVSVTGLQGSSLTTILVDYADKIDKIS